jgi:hypothetical protein
MDSDPLAYTVADAERLTGHGTSKIYQLMAANVLDARKAGKRTLIMGASLRDYINSLPKADIRTGLKAAA